MLYFCERNGHLNLQHLNLMSKLKVTLTAASSTLTKWNAIESICSFQGSCIRGNMYVKEALQMGSVNVKKAL